MPDTRLHGTFAKLIFLTSRGSEGKRIRPDNIYYISLACETPKVVGEIESSGMSSSISTIHISSQTNPSIYTGGVESDVRDAARPISFVPRAPHKTHAAPIEFGAAGCTEPPVYVQLCFFLFFLHPV